jgi:hypothetical protein
MKAPRKIDQPITQTDEPDQLLRHLQMTLEAAHTEARLAFQRQLEHYEILAHRIKQIRDALPKRVYAIDGKPRLKNGSRRVQKKLR